MDKKDLEELDKEALRTLAVQLDALVDTEQDDKDNKPKTDEELHAWIKDRIGVDIPRENVCPDHDAPFKIIADMFFERENSTLLVANRAGGKSFSAALIEFLSNYWKPGTECATVAAIESQAKRVYLAYKDLLNKAGEGMIRGQPLQSETNWINGSKNEILTASISAVNSPHPQLVHRDEVELMAREIYEESLSMVSSKTLADGSILQPQEIVTSTRKKSNGQMQRILNDIDAAIKLGHRPQYKTYIYCWKECVQKQPTCREAFPDLPESQKCKCNQIVSGEWSEGEPRLFSDVCNGSLARASGWKPLTDFHSLFEKTSQSMWESQHECKRPYVENVTLNISLQRHGIKKWDFDPANGPIYQGVDAGGSNPWSVLWFQVLSYEIDVIGWDGQTKRLPQGSIILFDEIYQAEIGANRTCELIKNKENEMMEKYGVFAIAGRFMDPQAKASRLDLEGQGLVFGWPVGTRDSDYLLTELTTVIDETTFFVLADKCPMFLEEAQTWEKDTPKRKAMDHAIDSAKMAVGNINAIIKKGEKLTTPVPTSNNHRSNLIPNQFDDTIPVAKKSSLHSNELSESDKWL